MNYPCAHAQSYAIGPARVVRSVTSGTVGFVTADIESIILVSKSNLLLINRTGKQILDHRKTHVFRYHRAYSVAADKKMPGR
jgi:predicted amidohydrolase